VALGKGTVRFIPINELSSANTVFHRVAFGFFLSCYSRRFPQSGHSCSLNNIPCPGGHRLRRSLADTTVLSDRYPEWTNRLRTATCTSTCTYRPRQMRVGVSTHPTLLSYFASTEFRRQRFFPVIVVHGVHSMSSGGWCQQGLPLRLRPHRIILETGDHLLRTPLNIQRSSRT
jgi:hypothetical protein